MSTVGTMAQCSHRWFSFIFDLDGLAKTASGRHVGGKEVLMSVNIPWLFGFEVLQNSELSLYKLSIYTLCYRLPLLMVHQSKASSPYLGTSSPSGVSNITASTRYDRARFEIISSADTSAPFTADYCLVKRERSGVA